MIKSACLVLCVGLATCCHATEEDGHKPVTVPFQLLPTKHLTVRIKVNGKGPYRVIFDTGAPVNLLSVKVGKEAGLVDANTAGSIFSLMDSMGQTRIKLLEVGQARAANVSAIVLDHPTIGFMSKAFGSIEGIVGFPFFARFSTTIDYRAQQLTLAPNGFEPPDVLKALAEGVVGLTGGGHDARILAPAGVWGIRLRKAAEDQGAGVTVAGVLPGSPAAAAGLQPDDRLLTIDGRWTDSVADVFLAASRLKPGAKVTVVILRGSKELKVEVQPAPGL
jgi:hypothetical protein